MKAKPTAKKASDSLHRNWQMLLYPESCAENWREYLRDTGVSWIASPLHDKDKYDLDDQEENGVYKKPHYHVIIVFEGKKKYDDIKSEIADPIGAVFPDLDNVVVTKDLRTAINYLTHDGFDDKALYSEIGITKSSSFDIDRFTQISENLSDQYLMDIIDYIENKDITEFRHIVLFSRYNQQDWFRVIKRNAAYLNHFITSRRNEKEKKEKAAAEASD